MECDNGGIVFGMHDDLVSNAYEVLEFSEFKGSPGYEIGISLRASLEELSVSEKTSFTEFSRCGFGSVICLLLIGEIFSSLLDSLLLQDW